MSLRDWIQVATPAIPATPPVQQRPTVAKIATVARVGESAACVQWRIGYPSLPAMTVLFTPAATRTEVAELYPGASIEPLPDAVTRAATPAEADELRALIAAVLVNDTEADRAEALAVALADLDAALVCWRSLAKGQGNSGDRP